MGIPEIVELNGGGCSRCVCEVDGWCEWMGARTTWATDAPCDVWHGGSWHGGSNAHLTRGMSYPPASGIPNIRHVLPTGNVPFVTSTEASSIMLPSDIISFELPTNGIGVCWKQASVKFDSSGQSRNWYPPPWTVRKLVIVSTVEPACHTVPVSYLGRTCEPRSPSLAYFVSVNSPFPGVAL